MEVSEQASWPDDFRCPISLEVMTDPVILPSGHTFERRSIQRWLDGGHLTCPVTNLPLPPSPPLIPNHALRRLIAAVSAAAVEKGGDGERQEVVSASSSSVSGLLRLAKSGAAGRREVLESGAAAVLLRHAAAGDEAAARALVHLSLNGDDARVGLVADDAVDALSAAVSGGGRPRGHGAHEPRHRGRQQVHHRGAPLGHPDEAARGNAATTFYELCKLPENRRCASAPCRRSPTWQPPVPLALSRCSASSRRTTRGAKSCQRSLKGYGIPSPHLPVVHFGALPLRKERGDNQMVFR